MVCKVNCAAITGIDVIPVMVETDVCNGLPSFDMVGLLSSDIKESRERVRTALKNSGFLLPPKRITVSFSPGNIRKTGTYFDLPLAISILCSLNIIHTELGDKIFIGELSLSGDVVRVNGVLPIVLNALEKGIRQCFVPIENTGECRLVKGITVIGVKTLNEVVRQLSTENRIEESITEAAEEKRDGLFQSLEDEKYDFKWIKGQVQARKAAQISAAGMHNLLLVGAPGTGKSVIAKSFPTILPDMSREEMIEISKIQSIAGNLRGNLVTKRPFRSPHHTITVSAMTGGGMNPKPGEVTLAHGGVLYLDELPEFSAKVMETLRQPLEDKKIVVTRMGGNYIFPADFILLAAMNPCRCGYYPDRNRCRCTEYDIKKYTEKISGPIMDRIDMCVHMNTVSYLELEQEEEQESSRQIKERINIAAEIQRNRYKDDTVCYNGQLEGQKLKEYCHLNKKEQKLMKQIYETMELSVRAYEKILKVARTIADLEEKEEITTKNIAEAVSLRARF